MKKLIIIILYLLLPMTFNMNKSTAEENLNKFIEQEMLNEGNELGIEVTLYLNYELNRIESLKYEGRKEKQTAIRKANYEYYYKKNIEYADSISIPYDDIEISAYSPFITYYYDNYNAYKLVRKKYIDLSKSEELKQIMIEKKQAFSDELYINTSTSTQQITLSEVKNMIGIDDDNYLGDNVKVGILDSGVPYNMESHDNYYDVNCSGVSSHANSISILFSEISPNASFYFCSRYNFEGSIRELFDNQVDIITMSYGVDTNGNYGALDLKIDFLSKYNDCIFICSAGNYANSNQHSSYITSPGISINAITVGAIDKHQHISCFSSFGLNPDIEGIKKPDIVAPGENIVISSIESLSGTSFSVPIVGGILARLIQQFDYICETEIFVTALLNGASKITGQTDIISEYCGSGLVNYSTSRDILLNQYYNCFSVNNNAIANEIVYEGTYTLGCYSVSTMYLYHMYNANDCQLSDSLNLQVQNMITKYKIELYEDSSLISETNLTSNIGAILFTNNAGSDKIYTIKIVLIGDKIENGVEKIVIMYKNEHEHVYSNYTKFNSGGHYKHCNCGYQVIDLHTVTNSASFFKRCIYCGEFVDTRTIIVRYE